jgi:hypothetical protein
MGEIRFLITLVIGLAAFASAGVQAQTLAPGTKVTDAASCQHIKVKSNVAPCQKCIAGGNSWTTGSGCSDRAAKKAAAAKAAPPKPVAQHTPPPGQLKPGTHVTDAAACMHIKVKKNVDACKACVGGGKPWVTGSGCSKS